MSDLNLKKDDPDSNNYYCIYGHVRHVYEAFCFTCNPTRADTERLDWMAENGGKVHRIGDHHWVSTDANPLGTEKEYQTPREAIDAAMNENLK